MIGADREWFGFPGASPEALAALRRAAGPSLPESYLCLLAFSNGGEGQLPVHPRNLCLDTAERTLEALESGMHAEFFPGFLIFGSNGGGDYLAFDTRAGGAWPVVTIDMVAAAESAEPVASDFDEFIALIGLEEPADD